MDKNTPSRFALPLAAIGFMLIIATGFNMLISDTIPLIVAVIGLALVIIAMVLRKKSMGK